MRTLIAVFESERTLRDAISAAQGNDIPIRNVYAPYEIELNLDDASLSKAAAALTRDCIWAAAIVFLAVFALEVWSRSVAFPIHVGARSSFAWPALVLPAIEAAMLAGGAGGLASFFVRAHMPSLADPIFETPDFTLATSDQFLLALPATQASEALVRRAGATAVHGVDR